MQEQFEHSEDDSRDLAWGLLYELGIDEIDRQHEDFVSFLKRVDAVPMVGDGTREEIAELLRQLVVFSRMHFSDEEGIMRSAGWSGVDAHHAEHARILHQVEDLCEKWEAGEVTRGRLVRFLWTWLVEHVSISDRELGKFLHGRADD